VTTTHRRRSQRRVDVASLLLLIVGLASGLFSYLLVLQGTSALVLIPAIVVATIGAMRITKLEAPRD